MTAHDAWAESLPLIGPWSKIQLKKNRFSRQRVDRYIPLDGDQLQNRRKSPPSLSTEIFLPEHICMYITHPFQQKKMHRRQSIIFLRVGFAIEQMYLNIIRTYMMRIMELYRNVGNESHHFRESSPGFKVSMACVCQPSGTQSDVIMLVGRHFADRMPSEYWMIVDDNRKTVCVHPQKDGEELSSLSDGTERVWGTSGKQKRYEDEYTWDGQTFFHTIQDQERENCVCQRESFSDLEKESMLWNLKNNRRNALREITLLKIMSAETVMSMLWTSEVKNSSSIVSGSFFLLLRLKR